VHVHFWILRRFRLDHQLDILNMDPAGGDVCRDQHADHATLESRQCAFTLRLGEIAADRSGPKTQARQALSQVPHVRASPTKDQRACLSGAEQEVDNRRFKIGVANHVHHVFYVAVRLAERRALYRAGVLLVTIGEPADLVSERRRDEMSQTLSRGCLNDGVEFLTEAYLPSCNTSLISFR
jgi:hypothetical protein